jgi:hypothetical protein
MVNLIGKRSSAPNRRFEPMLVLVVGVKIVEYELLAVRKSRGDAVHKVETLDAP